MDRTQAGHENERAEVNAGQKNHRTDVAHGGEQKFFAEEMTDRAARTLDVWFLAITEVARLPFQQARAGHQEQDDPGQTCKHPQPPIKKLVSTEAEQDRGKEIAVRPEV